MSSPNTSPQSSPVNPPVRSAAPRSSSPSDVFSVVGAQELAVVTRSGIVESRHAGSAVVIDPHGEVIRSIGDTASPVFARSTLKPFQAVAALGAGADLDGVETAIAMSSHTGTEQHVAVVRRLLQKASVTPDALRCPAALPGDPGARREVLQGNGAASPLYMTCSGKHAAMLLASVQNGWPTDTYCDADHPLQRLVADVIERFTGERPAATGVDGCGSPVFALSLNGLGRGYARIRTSQSSSPFALYRNAGRVWESALGNPWAIEGPGRATTRVIERLGVFAKGGSEGVMVMSAPDGTSVALKMLDGSSRASALVALHLLAQSGALEADDVAGFSQTITPAVRGGTEVVGSVEVSSLL